MIRRRVALGHTRLSIIDLEGGAQPLRSPCGRFALVANGEIYNHIELRDELRSPGRAICDAIGLGGHPARVRCLGPRRTD